MLSHKLVDFCVELSKKERLHWTNLLKSQFANEIEEIKSNIGANSPRQLIYHIINNLYEIPTCKCGNRVKWDKTRLRYSSYCSIKCAAIYTQSQRIATNLNKYGCENYAQSEEFIKKSKSTFIKKYGVDNPSKSVEIQLKKLDTNRKKYGVDNHSQIHLSQNTQEIITDKEKFINFAKGKTASQVADQLGLTYSGAIKVSQKFELNDFYEKSTRSYYEERISDLLKTLGVTFVCNSKSIISPYQLDFYIPKFCLAIEVGSMYFHCQKSHNKDRNYHKIKWELCQEKGITLLQYFDDDILQKWCIIESKIKRLCENSVHIIGARKLTVDQKITTDEERNFLDKFHLQGFNYNRTIVYGARYNTELVGILSIKQNKQHVEIVRYATNTNFSFPGLFSKLLKRFISDHNYKGKIISFSDNRHSNGQLYKSCGFVLDSITKPGYCYTKNYLVKENRLRFQKHLLSKKFNLSEEYVKNHSEWEIMQKQGYDRMWDAGQSKWILNIN